MEIEVMLDGQPTAIRYTTHDTDADAVMYVIAHDIPGVMPFGFVYQLNGEVIMPYSTDPKHDKQMWDIARALLGDYITPAPRGYQYGRDDLPPK